MQKPQKQQKSHVTREPIAIVGASALFAGSLGARGFWHDLVRGKDLLSDVPASHWLLSDYYDPDPLARDKTYAKRGAFLPDVEFDPMAWGVPPSSLPSTDTSQLLALVVAQQVLDDASRGDLGRVDRERTSVILGVTSAQELLGTMVSRLQRPVWSKALREMGLAEAAVEEGCERIASHYVEWQESSFPGLLGNVVAGRIANRLDLGGTNCVCDAACASTFSALSMAMNELHLGSSDLVITGGVDTMNDIFMYVCFSKTPALSRTGDCRPFSAEADGTMLGEGIGMVALKRLSDAEAAGDPIYAVIRGVGTSSDGRSKSVYAPVPEGQAKALRRAYEIAGYSPDTVELVEAHGTGTLAGDAAELAGLRLVFEGTERFARGERQFCALGSVKSQIGHTKSAAGAAGLFKAVMALHHRVLPPTIKVERPSPKLDLERSPFHLATELRPWIRDPGRHPRRAGVSSFGFGGSNFHVALEEYTGESRAKKLRTAATELVVLSAPSRGELATSCAALAAEVRAMLQASRATAHENEASVLQFVAWRSQRGAGQLAPTAESARAAIVAESASDLLSKLDEAASLAAREGLAQSPRGVTVGGGLAEQVCLVFPGQGSQYVGMGLGLALTFEAARAVWDSAAALDQPGPAPLHEVVFPRPSFVPSDKERALEELTRTERAQPAIGAASLATLALLRVAGLTPAAALGHSFGEVTALAAAGTLSTEDALRVAVQRGARMAEAAQRPGAMCAVLASQADVLAALEGAAIDVVVANHNGPRELVLSGETVEITKAEARLAERGLETRRLKVATAFHSPVVASAVQPFAEFLGGVPLGAPSFDVVANATAAPYPAEPGEARALLAAQLANPVRFVECVEAVHARGVRTFLEVGPGGVLTGLVSRILEGRPHHAIATDRKGKDALTSLHDALGRLFVLGVPLRLAALLEEFAEPLDPRSLPVPKMAIRLNGSNFGKVHPPNPPGTKPGALPPRGPAAATTSARAPQGPAAVTAAVPATVAPTPASTLAAPTIAALALREARPTPGGEAPSLSAAPLPPALEDFDMKTDEEESLADLPAELPTDVHLAWVAAFQEAQRQTVDAHVAYQHAMADSHKAFLRAQEAGFAGLASLLTGAPVLAPSVPSSATAQPVARAAPRLAAVPPAPAVARPALPSAAPSAPSAASAAPPAASSASNGKATAPSSAPAAVAIDLERTLLEVVALKTGYPVEMLGADMDLEADLGVDSIKRVEILAGLRERTPSMPQLDMARLGSLRTLAQIVGYVREVMPATSGRAAPRVNGTHAPSAGPAAGSTPGPLTVDLQKAMLEIVAQKTGYPVEMLGADMDLEADLGVDSIKRVEILAAMRLRVPNLPQLDMAKLGSLRTLAQIVDHMREVMPATGGSPTPKVNGTHAPTAGPSSGPTAADLQRAMLEIVAQKTGYPVEMLGADMDLEADLGVDSIKRVEILAAMRLRVPNLPQLDMARLGSLRTLTQIVDHMREVMGGTPEAPSQDTRQAAAAAKPKAEVGRWVTTAVDAPALGFVLRGLLDCRRCVVTDDGGGLADALVEALRRRGVRAEVAREVPEGTDGVVFLDALRAEYADAGAASSVALHLRGLAAARAASKALGSGSGSFVTVQDSGGDFGLSGSSRSYLAGLPGLVKTAAQEWPQAGCRALDLQRGERDPAALADAIADELLAGGRELEVGLREDGGRVTLASRLEPLAGGEPLSLPAGSVVVVSGGARGVTAACVLELTRQSRCRVLVLARTPLDEEPAELAAADSDAGLKKILLGQASARGEKPTPAALGARVSAILGAREVRSTLAAIREAGGDARYEVVDVTNAEAVASVLAEARRALGPIVGVIHGAGVLADKLIAQKTDAQAERVLGTKVRGLEALLAATSGDALRFFVSFSSVAARAGNRGQSDYAMANEVLNKVACWEQRRRPDCVFKSIGWGPWESGMVSPALRAELEAAGVPLVTLARGPRAMLDELARGAPGVDVVIGAEPTAEALASSGGPQRLREGSFEVLVDARTHAFVDDHRVKGQAVLPVVLAVEWMARAARALAPELALASLDELHVLRGIRLGDFDGKGDRFVVKLREVKPLELAAEVLGAGGARHYTANLRLASAPSPAGPPLRLTGAASPSAVPVYGGVLFHGPRFQVIRGAPRLSEDGIEADLVGTRAVGWGGAYLTDPALLDGGLQLALTFAKRATGGSSLPTAFRSLRWYGWETASPEAGRADGAVRCVVRSRALSADHTVSDLVFLDGERVVAELEGVEVHVLPGTREAAAQALEA